MRIEKKETISASRPVFTSIEVLYDIYDLWKPDKSQNIIMRNLEHQHVISVNNFIMILIFNI